MNKIVKESAERISAKISSPMIVDQYEFQAKGPFALIKNAFKNRLVLNQTESVFLDFKRKAFPLFAKDRYFEFLEAYKRKDKVDLIRLLSVPLYDVVKLSFKENTPLPFKLYKNLIDVELVQARICSHKAMAVKSSSTWHQLTLKFHFVEKDSNKDIIKYNVLERRESDVSDKDWRFCKID